MRLLGFLRAAAAMRAIQLVSSDSEVESQHSAESTKVLSTSLRESSLSNAGFTLEDVSGGEFFRLQVDEYTHHSIRIRDTSGWCDPSVRSWTGYLDVDGFGRDFFFYFFESRSAAPSEDPIVLWHNGGPGQSSAHGLFFEIGPCSIKPSHPLTINSTVINPHSWNQVANLLFIDSPINVGFSKGRNGQSVGTSEEAGQDLQKFLAIFFHTFRGFKRRELTLVAESYGGRYAPVFASTIYDGNAALVAAGGTAINLRNLVISDGDPHRFAVIEGYADHLCTAQAGYSPVLSISDCAKIAELQPRCKAQMQQSCLDTLDQVNCGAALEFCSQIFRILLDTGRSAYDTSKLCPHDIEDWMCYPALANVSDYLNLPEVRSFLGINELDGPYHWFDKDLWLRFAASHDRNGRTWLYVAALLERGIDVFVSVGKNDLGCNFVGQRLWMENLEWTGKDEYKKMGFRPWLVNEKVVGETKSAKSRCAGRLTYIDLIGAGHMAPRDRPEESAAFIHRVLRGIPM